MKEWWSRPSNSRKLPRTFKSSISCISKLSSTARRWKNKSRTWRSSYWRWSKIWMQRNVIRSQSTWPTSLTITTAQMTTGVARPAHHRRRSRPKIPTILSANRRNRRHCCSIKKLKSPKSLSKIIATRPRRRRLTLPGQLSKNLILTVTEVLTRTSSCSFLTTWKHSVAYRIEQPKKSVSMHSLRPMISMVMELSICQSGSTISPKSSTKLLT